MSHKRLKPTFAPTTVVAISSPLPTIELARIIPGPRAATVFQNVFGGGEYVSRLSPTRSFSLSVTPTPLSRSPLTKPSQSDAPASLHNLSMAYASLLDHN